MVVPDAEPAPAEPVRDLLPPVFGGGRPAAGTAWRPGRYAVLSLFCGALAQLGLVVAYGILSWPTWAAVLFSLAVSVGPSYWGSRTYVWKGLARHTRRVELFAFVVVALAGAATAIALTSLTEALGSLITDDRGALTAWVSAGSILATVMVWIARYAVLDRYLFRPRRGHAHA